MMKTYKLGNIAGLDLTIEPGAVIGSCLLWVVMTILANRWLALREPSGRGEAILAGLIATLLWWVADLVHYLGHIYASRQTGYPMTGIRFGKFLLLGQSLYPDNEGVLPGAIHIRRALGGPITSFGFTILTGLLAWLFHSVNLMLSWAMLYVCVVSFGMFTIGSLLPLGFTDGSTLLHWWGKE